MALIKVPQLLSGKSGLDMYCCVQGTGLVTEMLDRAWSLLSREDQKPGWESKDEQASFCVDNGKEETEFDKRDTDKSILSED